MEYELTFEEKELLVQVSKGDRKAFTALYSTYLNELYQFVYVFTKSRETASEIVQEIFVGVWEKRSLLSEVNAFRPYLLRAAKNKMISHLRHQKVKQKAVEHMRLHMVAAENATHDWVTDKENGRIIKEAISLLPPKRKLIVTLKMEDGFSLDEIAARLNISKKVVKKQLYKGMDFVRSYLLQHGEITCLLLFFLAG